MSMLRWILFYNERLGIQGNKKTMRNMELGDADGQRET